MIEKSSDMEDGNQPNHHNYQSLGEVIERIRKEDEFLGLGSHNMFIYDNLKSFEKFYCEYAAKWLLKNEIILIATQYQTFDVVEGALYKSGIDVTKHMDEGTLKIIDALQGYSLGDPSGVFKLAMSLLQRGKKEGRHGLTWIADLGSFIGLRKINDLMQYELSCPRHFQEDMIRTVCCYHEGDFDNLSQENQGILLNHHYENIIIR